MEPNTNPAATTTNINTTVTDKSSNKMVVVLIILVAIVALAFYVMKQKESAMITPQNPSQQSTGDDTLDELNSIEADLNSVDTATLDAGLE